MSYCTTAQVISQIGRLGKGLSTTSVPNTAADLTGFISDRSNQIDMALSSRGLSVPVVNTTPASPQLTAFLAELARLNAEGAAADMMLAAYITNDSNDRGTGAIKLKSFEARLDDFRKGIGIPVGIAVAETDLAVRSNATDAPVTLAMTLTDGEVITRTLPPGGEPFFRRRMRW